MKNNNMNTNKKIEAMENSLSRSEWTPLLPPPFGKKELEIIARYFWLEGSEIDKLPHGGCFPTWNKNAQKAFMAEMPSLNRKKTKNLKKQYKRLKQAFKDTLKMRVRIMDTHEYFGEIIMNFFPWLHLYVGAKNIMEMKAP